MDGCESCYVKKRVCYQVKTLSGNSIVNWVYLQDCNFPIHLFSDLACLHAFLVDQFYSNLDRWLFKFSLDAGHLETNLLTRLDMLAQFDFAEFSNPQNVKQEVSSD